MKKTKKFSDFGAAQVMTAPKKKKIRRKKIDGQMYIEKTPPQKEKENHKWILT